MTTKATAAQDYGIMPQAKGNTESFVDFMQRTSWFNAMTTALQRHSEFMRPELAEGDYPSMEYGYPNPHGQVQDGPLDTRPIQAGAGCSYCQIGGMWFDGPQGKKDAQYCFPFSGVFCMTPESDAAYSEFKKTGKVPEELGGGSRWPTLATFAAAFSAASWTVIQTKGTPQLMAEVGHTGSLMKTAKKACPGCWKCIGPSQGTWDFTDGNIGIKLLFQDVYGNKCQDNDTLFGDCCNVDYVALTFDDPSTPGVIAPGASISIFMLDGCGPYDWTVSGQGYSLAAATTAGPSNTLSLADEACGTSPGQAGPVATITVTDKCGTTVPNILIKSTAGDWLVTGACAANCSGGSSCSDMATCSPHGADMEEVVQGLNRNLYSPGSPCIYNGRNCSTWMDLGAACEHPSIAGNPLDAWAYFFGGGNCNCSGTAGKCYMSSFGSYVWGCPP